MAFQLSPGVSVSEIDLTTVVPSVGTTEGGFVGNFVWGPANTVVNLSNELDLVNIFGKPDSNTFSSFFTAANFLGYAQTLRTVRVVGSGAKNATDSNTAVLITNKDRYEATYRDSITTTSPNGYFAARYAGSLGNSLKVSVSANGLNTNAFSAWAYNGYFDSKANTSAYATAVGSLNDEMHIVVIDENGAFSGQANTVLERFGYVSKASDAKNDDGSSNYYVNVINDRSKYIYVMAHANSNWGTAATNQITYGGGIAGNDNLNYSLTGGVTADPSSGEIISGYNFFKNPEEIDVSLILTGPHPFAVAQHVVDNICEIRRDCVAFISPPSSNVVNQLGQEATNAVTFRNGFNSSSYAVMDSAWKYQFDKYNNVYRWVPLNGDTAGLCARTDLQRDPWFSPAGFTRGQIKNAIKLSWNPNKTERDALYKNGINPVVTFPGEGILLYGDKTMLAKPSAFDRINVRRLFIVLEKAIARASRYSLFEFNDEFTRAQFVALVEPFLRDVQGRRGIYDFRVVCDSTNNTPEVIDRNEFVGDIYIKPARSINFIQLNFVAVRSGVAFDEIVGKF
jgi:phage tail sheath protein FI